MLTPENRSTGDLIQVDSIEGNCGENAFTASYRLMNPARAHAEGYRVHYSLPPR